MDVRIYWQFSKNGDWNQQKWAIRGALITKIAFNKKASQDSLEVSEGHSLKDPQPMKKSEIGQSKEMND